MNSNLCAVFLCNLNYFNKFLYTCNQLITIGNYKEDICLVIGDDLKDHELLNNPLIINNNIKIKYFPNIILPNDFLKLAYELERPPHWFKKMFQYHKLHLFNTFFKEWKYIFYLDCGITIFSDIKLIDSFIKIKIYYN